MSVVVSELNFSVSLAPDATLTTLTLFQLSAGPALME